MKTILLVDDDQAVLSMFSRALENHGYRTIVATTGDEGLSLARRHLPDLILCDVNMPRTDGRTVLQTLRVDAALAGKQFVLMTGDTFALTPRGGMELGADDFLVKPFNADALIRCVEARLARAAVHWRIEDRMIKDLRSELRSTLPHEFFTPLAGVLGMVDVLRGDITQLSAVELSEILDAIECSGVRLHRTLKNYLLVLDLDSGERPELSNALELTAAQARGFIADATDKAIRRHDRYSDITISLESSPRFRVMPELAVIAEELVENACSFSRKGTPILVELGSARIAVTDHGRGMTFDEIRQVGAFRQFHRARYEQQGLGLGLSVVQRLAQRYRGRLDIHSEPGKATKATVTFEVRASDQPGATAENPPFHDRESVDAASVS